MNGSVISLMDSGDEETRSRMMDSRLVRGKKVILAVARMADSWSVGLRRFLVSWGAVRDVR